MGVRLRQIIRPAGVAYSGAVSSKPFNLAAGEWWQVPRVGNSRLSDVYATNPGGGQDKIMGGFSGACFDSSRKDLIVWGGGHTDYQGNEVYAFNLVTLVWRRKCNPSTPANNDGETNGDGSPASRHTYAGLNYNVARDSMVVAAGGYLAGPTGVRSNATWEFACSTETPNATAPGAWTRRDDCPTISPGSGPEPYMSMAFDSASGKYFTQHNRGFCRYDPSLSPGSQWTALTNFEGPAVTDEPVCVAPLSPSQIIWPSGADSGEVFGRRLDTNAYIGAETTGLPASGALNILDVTDPGCGWDPIAQRVIIWGGTATGGTDNRDVYSLNVGTKVITKVTGTGDIPTNPAAAGTFGRFAYLGAAAGYEGLWLLVNSTTTDCYFYRSS